MRKTGWMTLALAAVVGTHSVHAGQTERLSAGLGSLEVRGKKAEGPCQAYAEELRAALKAAEVAETEAVPRIAAALSDPPPALSPYRRLMAATVRRLPRLSETDATRLVWQSHPCSPVVEEYRALKLMLSTDHRLGETKQTRARRLTIAYLNRHASVPGTLLEKHVQLALLNQLVKDGYVTLEPRHQRTLEQLREDAEVRKKALQKRYGETPWPATEAGFRRLPEASRKRLVDTLRVELEESERVGRTLRALYQTIPGF